MSYFGVIGRVVAQGEGRWEWIIRDFPELPRREDAFFCSPDFEAEGEGWWLRIDPNGTRSQTQIRIWLWRTSFLTGPSVSCTVGVKRADHQEETMGTKNCGIFNIYPFGRTRRELEEEAGVWLPGGRLTLTLHFGPPKDHTTSIPRDIRTKQSTSAIDQDSRRNVSQPLEAKAAREFTSRETQTDAMDENSTNTGAKRKLTSSEKLTDALDAKIPKVERLENCTCTKEGTTSVPRDMRREQSASAIDPRRDVSQPPEAKGVEKLRSDYKKLLESGAESDLVVVVSGREFRVHKAILRARSPVFDAMFEHDTKEKQSGRVVIQDLDPDPFRDFLEYLYTGRVEALSDDNVFALYAAADKYQVPELKSEASERMRRTMSVANFCDVMALALRHAEQDLVDGAVEFFKDNLPDIVSTAKWQAFMRENPEAANEILVKAFPKTAK